MNFLGFGKLSTWPLRIWDQKNLASNVATKAGEFVIRKGFVSAIDLLMGLGWLTQKDHDTWRKGQVSYLECVVTANLSKISSAMKEFRAWATHSKLKPSVTVYKHKSCTLRFSKSGEPGIEKAYATHFVLPTWKKIEPNKTISENATAAS